LRRTPALGRRTNPFHQVFPDCDAQHAYDGSSRTPNDPQCNPRPRRSRSCMPTNLIWLEDEEQWIVAGREAPSHDRTHARQPSHSMESPISPLSSHHPATFRVTSNYNYWDRADLPSHLSPFDNHGSGPQHVTHTGSDRVSRWISVVERTQENRRSWT
jgi:hypothetical protein